MASIVEHIVIEPGVCGGRPHIAGHRIRVQDIVALHEQAGYGPDEIASAYPGITLAEVYAALAWYHDDPEPIRAAMMADNTEVERLRDLTPSRLVTRLHSPDGR